MNASDLIEALRISCEEAGRPHMSGRTVSSPPHGIEAMAASVSGFLSVVSDFQA